MARIVNIQMIKQIIICAFIILAGSCTDHIDDSQKTTGQEGASIKLSFNTSQMLTKAGEMEKSVEELDILVFEKINSVFIYQYTVSAGSVNDSKCNITLKSNDNENSIKIYIVANGKEAIESAGLTEYMTEEEVKGNLIQKYTKAGLDKIPMTAEHLFESGLTNGQELSVEVSLLRSIATVRVSLGNSVNNFRLKSIQAYRANDQIQILPDETEGSGDNIKVTEPSIPDNTNYITEETEAITNVEENTLEGLYIPEATGYTDPDEFRTKATCLVIGGIYGNDSDITYYRVDFKEENEDEVGTILRNYKYNITITSVDGPGVSKPGTAGEEAPVNMEVSIINWSEGEMKYVVFHGPYYLAVSESELTIPRPADTHSLNVKTNYPTGWKAGIAENTDWMDTLLPTSSPNINTCEPLSFNVTENTGTENRKGRISISCSTHLTLDVDIIQTTEIDYTLKIEIDDPDNPGEYMEFDRTIIFSSGYHEYYEEYDITPRTLKITWSPINEDLIVDYNRYFEWGDQTDIQSKYEGGTGQTTMTVIPSRLKEREDWYPEAIGDIQIQVGEESSTKQNVLIKRKHHEVYIEKADRYVAEEGKTYSFKLYANTNWYIKKPLNEENENQQLDLDRIFDFSATKTQGGSNLDTEGEDIFFKFQQGISGDISADIPITIYFEDIDQEIPKEYIFHVYREEDPTADIRFAEGANCYVLQTGGRGVSIPVGWANKSEWNSPNHIGDKETLSYKLVWTDHKSVFDSENEDDNRPIKSMQIEGSGPDARLIVKPGKVAGNAVVAVTNAAGNNIYWSWHIWVVRNEDGFDPYADTDDWPWFRNYQFLDRNLGALTTELTDAKSLGLYYQWGRKDPFPGPDGINSTTLSKRYRSDETEIDWSNSIWKANYSDMTANRSTLVGAIKEPHRFICPQSSTNWYSAIWNATETREFWNIIENGSLSTSEKGHFDPCPEGWKTVPGGDQLNAQWGLLPQIVSYNSGGNYSTIKGTLQSITVDLGIWPHMGYISGNTGNVTNTTEGHYWTGSANTTSLNEAWRTIFRGEKNAHPSESHSQMHGLPIRCMRRVGTEK